jgi:glycosyltransferase involved in cell wall biosynthesis
VADARPPVSAVVPVLDGASFLDASLRSLLRGTAAPDEVIVVDDGSSDGSADVAAAVPGVRVIRQEHAGVAAARNRGFAASRHGLVVFHDADDLRTEDGLAAQLRALAQAPGAGCVIGRQELLVDGAEVVPEGDRPWWAERGRDELAAVGQMLVTRPAFERVGGFASGVHLEDVDWLVRARAAGVEVVLIDDPVILRRAHSANRSADLDRTRSDLLDILRRRMAGGRPPR